MFWPIVGFAYLVYKLFTFRRQKPEVIAVDPIVLYQDEVAATITAIDEVKANPQKKSEMKKAIVELIDEIIKTITFNLGVKSKEYRLYIVAAEPIDDKQAQEGGKPKAKLSGFRDGRVFRDRGKGKVSESEFQALLDKDASRVETFLADYDSAICFTKIQGTDEEAVLMMARNPGKYLRMGVYVHVNRPGAQIEDFREAFIEVCGVLSTLGFVDEIRDFVREYRQGGR